MLKDGSATAIEQKTGFPKQVFYFNTIEF